MRRLLLCLVFCALVSPARAQGLFDTPAQSEAWAQRELDRQRGIALENELRAQIGRAAVEQSLSDLRRQLDRPPLGDFGGRPAPYDPTYVDIPDDRLAASNARVRAAAGLDGRAKPSHSGATAKVAR